MCANVKYHIPPNHHDRLHKLILITHLVKAKYTLLLWNIISIELLHGGEER